MSLFKRTLFWTEIATANAKGGKNPHGIGAGGPKLGLAPSDDRIRRALARFRLRGVTLVFLQEFAEFQYQAVRDGFAGYDVYKGTPNDRWPSGATVGNGVAIDPIEWKVLDRDELEVEGVGGQTLHLPVFLLKHRASKRRVLVICVHFPAGKSAAARQAKARCEHEVYAYIARVQDALVRAGIPEIDVVVGGDCNNGRAFRNAPGYRHLVDVLAFITGGNGFKVGAGRTHTDFKGDVSDHMAISVKVAFKAAGKLLRRRLRRLTALPKVAGHDD